VWFWASSLRSAREDVPAELTLHERREDRGTHVARGAHVTREARGGRTEGRRAKGKSRLLSYFFLLGFIVQMLVGRRLSGIN